MATQSNRVYRVEVGTSVDELNDLIATAPTGARIILRDGEHRFDDSIRIDRSDVMLSGESEAGTKITFNLNPDVAKDGVVIGGHHFCGDIATVVDGTNEGSKTLSLNDASQIKAGDFVYVSQANTDAYLSSRGDDVYNERHADRSPFRETIAKVVSVSGDRLKLESEVGQEFDAGQAHVQQIAMVENVTLRNLTISYDLGTPNHNDFENNRPDYLGASGVRVINTYGVNIHDVSVVDAASHSFWFENGLNAKVHDIYADGNHNKGTAGNGYGVLVTAVSHSEFTELELFNNRHAFIFSSWHAENYNDIHIADTNRDINFHGSFDHSNTVVVDRIVQEYVPSEHTGPGAGVWNPVSLGGRLHVDTDIYGDNTVVLHHVEAHNANDEIFASETLRVMSGGGGADTLHANGRDNYLDGGSGDDIVYGFDGNDVIAGGAGRDTLEGGRGDDRIEGGKSADDIDGGMGSDTLKGDDGADDIKDDHGHDVLFGGANNDTLDSGMGSDSVFGGSGADLIYGGSGSDRLSGGDANDRINGGYGEDVITGDAGNDVIYGGSNNDSLYGGGGYDKLFGGAGVDHIRGGASNDRLEGGFGKDALYGDEGYDTLVGGSADDALYGGDHNDRLEGGSGSDLMRGGDGTDRIYGDSGHDVIKGDDGKDHLFGGVGQDTVEGGAGSDRIKGDGGKDDLFGGYGIDTIYGGEDDDVIAGGGDKDVLYGGEGRDEFVFGRMTSGEIDRIKDYEDGLDKLVFAINGVDGLDDLAIYSSGDNVRIDIDRGGSIILEDAEVAQIGASDFVFA